MRAGWLLPLAALALLGLGPARGAASLIILPTYTPPQCGAKARDGDRVRVHYTGKLQRDGSKFDSSLDRGEPFSFVLGQGAVIKGWDQGIKGMCVGEKRTLTIPPDLAYGAAGMPPVIPPSSTLVFTTELVGLESGGSPAAARS